MRDALPNLEDLPEVFPAFPLTGALVLPRGRLPLNIFEPRYLAMTEDALGQGRMFAMIQPDARLAATPQGPGLYGVGCLGRLSSFSETEDGRYLITLTGLIRFDVVAEMEMRRGYRRLRGDFSRFAIDLAQTPAAPTFDRPALLAALRAYFVRRGFNANWESIDGLADDALVTSLAMVCPFAAAGKQALLEAITLAERAQILRTLLSIDTHEPPDGSDDTTAPRRMAS